MSYDKVRAGKLSFKGGGSGLDKKIAKKKKKKQQQQQQQAKELEGVTEDGGMEQQGKEEEAAAGKKLEGYEIDTGIGHAPDGKKSKKYEELFPVETKRFGYEVVTTVETREAALDERVKKKADRYCKSWREDGREEDEGMAETIGLPSSLQNGQTPERLCCENVQGIRKCFEFSLEYGTIELEGG